MKTKTIKKEVNKLKTNKIQAKKSTRGRGTSILRELSPLSDWVSIVYLRAKLDKIFNYEVVHYPIEILELNMTGSAGLEKWDELVKTIHVINNVTRDEAFYQVKKLYFDYFKTDRYKDYDSLRSAMQNHIRKMKTL